MDQMVLKAQKWVNATYGSVAGYVKCAEDGSTGWQTMYSLTRALQHELGITAISDTFGPTTLSYLTAYGNVGPQSTNMNMRTIAEAALYCKGYSGGNIDGAFGSGTQAGLYSALTNMGIAAMAPYSVAPKVFKALLTMDAYVLVNNGDAAVQAAQRWLNANFFQRTKFFIGPCDGHYSRSVQVALTQALQYSMGLGDSGADGNIGGGTETAMRAQAEVWTGGGQPIFVQLFRAAMTFNNRPNVWQNASTTFTGGLADSVSEFQSFCKLTVNGRGDYETWMSLLLSTGDPTRRGKAIDVMHPLTSSTIATVTAANYQIVGRYLTGGTNKVLTNSEIALIFAHGMSFFPLYQEFGDKVTYFSYDQGFAAGQAAYAAAKSFTIPDGTTIYFSVDFDALDTEIASAVIPHFRGINDAMNDDYAIGVYGCRNVCIQLANQGLTSSSFVSGMSWGYSGNLGYPLPDNWAFDQIANYDIGTGDGFLEIDNDIVSGSDPGVSSVSRSPQPNDQIHTYLLWLEARAVGYIDTGKLSRGVPELVAQWLRYLHQLYEFTGAEETFGQLDSDWIAYVKNQGNTIPDYASVRDPVIYRNCDLEHFGASFGAVVNHEVPSPDSGKANLSDIGGWGGDLISVLGSLMVAGLPISQAYDFAKDSIATLTNTTYFSMGDMLADVDALVFGQKCKQDSSALLSDLFNYYYSDRQASIGRFSLFLVNRFGSGRQERIAAASAIFYDDSDAETVLARNALWTKDFRNSGFLLIGDVPNTFKDAVAQAFVDVVTELADR